MNRIITTHVLYRGTQIPVEQLKEQSQINVEVECSHGRRVVRWCRRNQLCKKCAAESGVYNTSLPGREISWGNKISEAKKGIKLSDKHKNALIEARLNKIKRINSNVVNFANCSSDHIAVHRNIARSVRHIIKRKTNFSFDPFKKLNYSKEDLIKHLELKFQPGMTWDNYGYGGWHVDHVIPDSWFVYSSVEDQGFKDSWKLDNLQPMWAKDNIKKSNYFSGKEFKKHQIVVLAAQSGAGKTTLLKSLNDDTFFKVPYDDHKNFTGLLMAINSAPENKPILIDISFTIGSTVRRLKEIGHEVELIVMIEDPQTVSGHLINRANNTEISGVNKRYNRMCKLAQKANFSGTSNDVIKVLKQYDKKSS